MTPRTVHARIRANAFHSRITDIDGGGGDVCCRATQVKVKAQRAHLDRARHFVGARQPSGCLQRRPVDRLHVYVGAIECGKAGIAPLECEEEIRPTEQNDLCAVIPAQALAGSEKYAPLRIADLACGCHRRIVLVHLVKFRA